MILYRRGGGGSCVKNAEARRTGPRARTRTRTGDAHGGRGTKDGRRRTGDGGRKGARRVARGLGFMPFRAKILDITPGFCCSLKHAVQQASAVDGAARRDRRAPSMGIDLEVKVLPKAGHGDRSEPQGRNREGSSGGSGERSRGPTNRNPIRGVAEQGERASNRKALVTKARRRRSGGRAVKVDVLTWGDLASCLKGRRRTGVPPDGARSQQRP